MNLMKPLLALSLLTAAANATATDGYFAHGYGVKSQGMGGVGIALPQDAIAAASNPAGMGLIGDRMDVGMTYNFKKNDKRKYKQSLVFSVYNAYNRRNAFSIYFRTKTNAPLETEAVRLSIVGSIIPAVTYNFNF